MPHDWSIEDLTGTQSPFTAKAVGQSRTGFTEGCIGWYRKSFIISESDKDKIIQLQFDGVYMNAEVWLNGQLVGKHAYGYSTFMFDNSDKILLGKENILAVKVQNEDENSRWYSGSDIYRHVWLNFLNPVHFSQWGTLITTPEINTDKKIVNTKYHQHH